MSLHLLHSSLNLPTHPLNYLPNYSFNRQPVYDARMCVYVSTRISVDYRIIVLSYSCIIVLSCPVSSIGGAASVMASVSFVKSLSVVSLLQVSSYSPCLRSLIWACVQLTCLCLTCLCLVFLWDGGWDASVLKAP